MIKKGLEVFNRRQIKINTNHYKSSFYIVKIRIEYRVERKKTSFRMIHIRTRAEIIKSSCKEVKDIDLLYYIRSLVKFAFGEVQFRMLFFKSKREEIE